MDLTRGYLFRATTPDLGFKDMCSHIRNTMDERLLFYRTMESRVDNHKIMGIVSMDLSKVFDTPPHDLIVLKLKQ